MIVERWRTIRQRNLGSVDEPAMASFGWVLEARGEIVGFFGNIRRRYRLDGRDLQGAVASSWAVQREFRGLTGELAAAYFGQSADLFLVNTAGRSTARIFAKHSGEPMPDLDYSKILYWVLDARAFLRAALLKIGLPDALAAPSSMVLASAQAVARVARLGSRRTALPATVAETKVVPPEEIGTEFDVLWEARSAFERRLFSNRSADELRCILRLGSLARRLTLLKHLEGKQLRGYLLLSRTTSTSVPLIRARIVDLWVEDDRADVIRSLLSSALEEGARQGCHVLEMMGLPGSVRRRLSPAPSFSRRYPVHPYAYKAPSSDLAARLRSPDAWYACPVDGDAFL